MKPAKKSCFNCDIINCTILKNCNDDALRILDKEKYYMTFMPNQVLFHEGSKTDGVYVIADGIVKIHIKGHKGRQFILRLAKTGSIVGHTADKDGKQPAAVTAIVPTRVCFIETKHLDHCVDMCLPIQHEMLETVKLELKYINEHAVRLLQMTVREKIAETLVQIALAYGLDKCNLAAQIALSRQDISDMSGTTKEQVSKVMSELSKEGIIKTRGKTLQVLNYEKLRALA